MPQCTLFAKNCSGVSVRREDELVGGGIGVEDFADFAGEGSGSKRLGEELGVGIEDAVMDDGVFGVAGHEENFDAGPT